MENQSILKWYQRPIAVILFLIFFFPVGIYLMWKFNLWNKTSRVLISVFFGLFVFANISKGKTDNPTRQISKKVTFSEARSFMRDRLSGVNQTLMDSKTTSFDGKTIYCFLSVTENGTVCISSVSEFALEVLASDCGDVHIKTEQWNNL